MLLQGIFLTQGSNPPLPCLHISRWVLYRRSQRESPLLTTATSRLAGHDGANMLAWSQHSGFITPSVFPLTPPSTHQPCQRCFIHSLPPLLLPPDKQKWTGSREGRDARQLLPSEQKHWPGGGEASWSRPADPDEGCLHLPAPLPLCFRGRQGNQSRCLLR